MDQSVVVVTGGAGALGQAVVGWFTARGAKIAVLDYSDELLAAALDNVVHVLYGYCNRLTKLQLNSTFYFVMKEHQAS